jgi:gamma-butyrobetaine dioxygenase
VAAAGAVVLAHLKQTPPEERRAMQILSVQPRGGALTVLWSDGSSVDYPYPFLRDNDPADFHPQTQERLFDLLSVPENQEPASITLANDAILIDWAGSTGCSVIDAQWLSDHRPGQRSADPADIAAMTWGSGFVHDLPRFDASAILQNETAFRDWLVATKRYGLSVVQGLRDDEAAGVEIGERVGFLRRSNFGITFRVETKPDPNNLAYTAHALALHTDLPNQELPPGFQFLHCIRNEADGGGSVFADAFRIADHVRDLDAEAFHLLTRIPIPYRFHDRDYDIRVHRPLVGLDERGRVFDVRYSAHLMDAFDMEAEVMIAYYRALRLFMAETRNAANIIAFKLCAGEMVVFDNRRVLHGREAFDPATGHRLLKGFYVDRGEFDSRIRVISRRL